MFWLLHVGLFFEAFYFAFGNLGTGRWNITWDGIACFGMEITLPCIPIYDRFELDRPCFCVFKGRELLAMRRLRCIQWVDVEGKRKGRWSIRDEWVDLT